MRFMLRIRRVCRAGPATTRLAAFCLSMFVLLNVGAAAQEPVLLSLLGRVVDATGGVVPGATVVLTGPAPSQDRRTAFTDRNGRYEFRGVTPGVYAVTAELAGFRAAIVPSVDLRATEPSRNLDLKLEAGNVAESVTVTATRVATPIAAIPASVTVLDRDTIEEQAALTRNLDVILAKTLPGLGLSRESESNFGQSLRGRGMLVLLDGVPQNFELRQGAVDELSRIDPSRIERVEVVR
jgi:iron complex outermembrane receptor protein